MPTSSHLRCGVTGCAVPGGLFRWGLGALITFHVVAAMTGCVGRPHIGDFEHAMPKLRCDYRPLPGTSESREWTTEECAEYANSYLDDSLTFTCDDPEDLRCRHEFVTASSEYFSDDFQRRLFGDEIGAVGNDSKKRRPYNFGVALGGGGTKAAAYAIGILAGLHDTNNENLNTCVDAISSVSGGSYAAVWYFSRLLDKYQIRREHGSSDRVGCENIFGDCLPISYRALHTDTDPEICPASSSQFPVPQRECPNSSAGDYGPDPYRFQNHLRGYQDVFSKNFVLDPHIAYQEYEAAWSQASQAVVRTLPVLPVHWFANGLFDWGVNLSPSGRRYFGGIAKTYSFRPANCNTWDEFRRGAGAGASAAKRVCYGDAGRPAPNNEAARGHTMSALSNLYYQQLPPAEPLPPAKLEPGGGKVPAPPGKSPVEPLPRIPFWIANTTAGVDRSPLTFDTQNADLEDSVFEFTPYSFGSRHFGRWIGTPTDVELWKIAGASGAFLDAQQRTLPWMKNAMAAAAMGSLAASWGVSIANPRWRDEVRIHHALLPFPFYLMHHNSPDRNGAWIHLSDGGQSDNTGVWSLIRRGATTILLADESQDEDGRLSDLCNLRKQLAPRGLALLLPGLQPKFESVCDALANDEKIEGGAPHYDVRAWKQRVVRGCITSETTAKNCERRAATYFARLFVLKPALDLEFLRPFLDACNPKELSGEPNESSTCAEQLSRLRTLEDHPEYRSFPAELFGFLTLRVHETVLEGDAFPQNSTIWMTLDSNPALFGAYRELAAWQMRDIGREIWQDQDLRCLSPMSFGDKAKSPRRR